MKKYRLFFLFCFVSLCVQINAQSSLTEKRIYLLDVTKSMVGKGSVKTPDIFGQLRQSLISAIDDIEDRNTEIVIIPFTNKPHQIIRGYVSQKDSLSAVISKLYVKSGNTNIADAWSAGVAQLDSTKVNYMFLLTDGLHNTGPSEEEFLNRLERWDSIRAERNFYAFYVMLTENAVDQKIRKITDKTPQMWNIRSLNIKTALLRTPMKQRVNVFNHKYVGVSFVSNSSKSIPLDLDVKFELEDNPYYEVVSTKATDKSGKSYRFEIREKLKKIEMPTETTLKLHIDCNKEKYPLLFFTPEDVMFVFVNRGVRCMTIKEAKVK